jgi:HTH-type transcriptional regulator/antitoxin MqsA
MESKLTCVMCGSDRLLREESERLVDIDGEQVKVPFRIHSCEACGIEAALNEDLRFNARAMRCARKKHYGVLTGEEIRRIRKLLGLSQEQAAKLFGGGPVAFSKYENEEITQNESMDRLIWLVGRYPDLVASLAKRLNIALPGKAEISITRFRAKFDMKYFAQVLEISEDTHRALQGFCETSTASNDKIYSQGKDSRPAKWSVA